MSGTCAGSEIRIALVTGSTQDGMAFGDAADQFFSVAVSPTDVVADEMLPDCGVITDLSGTTGAWSCNNPVGYAELYGTMLTGSAVTFAGVTASSPTINRILVYMSGVAGVSDYLIGQFTTDKCYQPVSIVPDGDDITINWAYQNYSCWGSSGSFNLPQGYGLFRWPFSTY